MSSAGGPVAREEAGWCYSAEDCEAWPSYLCTGYISPLPWVCLVSGRTGHKRMIVQLPEAPITCRLPPPVRTCERPGKYPTSRTFRADTLTLLNGNDLVSQPVGVHSKQLNASECAGNAGNLFIVMTYYHNLL